MSQQQQNSFTKVLAQQKKTFYQFTNQLVNNQFNIYIYYLLIAIQHLQFVAYQCHQIFQYNNLGVHWFRTFTHFFNPQHYLKHSNLMNYLIPISFVLTLIHFILIYYSYYKHKNKNVYKDTIQTKKHTHLIITHYMTVIMTIVLTTPILLASLLVFYCHPGSPYHPNRTCYDTYHLFLILMALVNVVWILTINVYYFLFYYTRNPFAYKNFLGLSSSLYNMLKFVLKVVGPSYLIFDEILAYNILFVFGVAAGLLGYTAISRVLYPYTRFNKYIQRMMITIEVLFICVSLLFILQAFFTQEQGNGISFIVSFIIAIPLAEFAYKITMNKKQKNLLKINEYEKDKCQIIQQLLQYLIVELQDDSIKQIKSKRFFKVVKFHKDQCSNVQCACYQYLKKYQEDHDYYQDKQLIYKIFVEIIDRCVQNNRKAYSLLLLKSYIEYYRLDNGIKGAFIISKIMRQKISFLEDYLINGFLYEVSKSFQDTTNIQTYRQFSQHLIKYQKEAMSLAQSYSQFWQQICQQNSSLKKVMKLLKKAKQSKQIIDKQFDTLYKIYPQNVRILDIYKQLYKQVLINYDQFMKYKNLHKDNMQQKQESKLIRPNHQMKFMPNQDLIVISTSVNVANDIFHGGCQIISVTNNVYKVLGYSSHDLIGKNINRFLPKIYADFHDDIIDNYLSRDSMQQKPRQLIIFPINSSGHLVQCAMVNKIMPSLEYGVNIVSFLLNSKLSKQNLIIYDQRTGLVDSMSQKAEGILLGKKQKKNSISIPDHISDVMPVWDYVKQQTNQHKKKSGQQIHFAFNNVCLYRSDGPGENKYVKIITFQLAFQSKIFTMHECMSEGQNFWVGFQTLVENTPFQLKLVQKPGFSQNQENKQSLNQSPNAILKKIIPPKTNRQSMILEDTKLYQSLPEWYPKVYLSIQILVLLGIIGVIIYNYARSLGYYDVLRNDILIKEQIIDNLDSILQNSHTVSQYVFSGGDLVIFEQVDVDNVTSDLKNLIGISQFIYQQMVKKQELGQITFSQLQVDIQYFTSPTTIVIKTQSVTDASYQMVLYLLQIYKNTNPIQNLANSIQFVFRNCLNISTQLFSLNEIFTQNVFKNSRTRKSNVLSIVIGILVLFFVSLLWESIYRLVIDSKINKVIEIYEAIPIQQLQKYPTKCHNFIKYVCPAQTPQSHIQATAKSIRHLGSALTQQMAKKQMQQNESKQLLQQQEQVQYITFSQSLPLGHILFQSIIFLVIFSGLFIIQLTTQSSLLDQNLYQISEWNKITRFKSQLIKTVYLLNEHKNRANQWNISQISQLDKYFYQSLTTVQYLLKSTSILNDYLSISYELIEQSVFIINNNITSQQFILHEQKLFILFERLQLQKIVGIIELKMEDTITGFLSMLQLIFIGEIIVFLLYAIIYIPRSYKIYRQKSQITQMMYHTLGYKLQNIAKSNFQNR